MKIETKFNAGEEVFYKEAREQLIVELIKVYKIGCPKLH